MSTEPLLKFLSEHSLGPLRNRACELHKFAGREIRARHLGWRGFSFSPRVGSRGLGGVHLKEGATVGRRDIKAVKWTDLIDSMDDDR